MKFLITGANGQLGQELQKLLTERELDFVALSSKLFNDEFRRSESRKL